MQSIFHNRCKRSNKLGIDLKQQKSSIVRIVNILITIKCFFFSIFIHFFSPKTVWYSQAIVYNFGKRSVANGNFEAWTNGTRRSWNAANDERFKWSFKYRYVFVILFFLLIFDFHSTDSCTFCMSITLTYHIFVAPSLLTLIKHYFFGSLSLYGYLHKFDSKCFQQIKFYSFVEKRRSFEKNHSFTLTENLQF